MKWLKRTILVLLLLILAILLASVVPATGEARGIAVGRRDQGEREQRGAHEIGDAQVGGLSQQVAEAEGSLNREVPDSGGKQP